MVNKYDNYELRKVTSLENAPGTIKDGDGYVWDPSELPDKDFDDSKVPLNYRRLAIWMRSKLFGKDVRETIARLAEMFGLNFKELMGSFESLDNRQDAVETQFNQSVAQMEADKNAVIANATVDSEVILARGGKATLGVRLDETTAQLVQKAMQDDLVVERARIDSLSRLSEGSTAGDAELIDARVGADGIIYDTAGGAIRGQINKVNSERAEDKLEVATFKEEYTAQFNKGFPSQASNLRDNRAYTIKLQLSSEGNPQLISKEVL